MSVTTLSASTSESPSPFPSFNPEMHDPITASLKDLFSYDPIERNAFINQFYIDQVVYKHPLWNVQGISKVKKLNDLWANINKKQAKIIDVVFDGQTAIIRTEILLSPRVFPLITLPVPASTVLRFAPDSAGDLKVYAQEDVWTVQGLLEAIPIVGWWYKNVVLRTMSIALMGTSDAVTKTLTLNNQYVHPLVLSAQNSATQTTNHLGHTVQRSIHSSAEVAGVGYQLATDSSGAVINKASLAAGQGVALAKAYQTSAERYAEDLRHKGAVRAGIVAGAAKGTLEQVLEILKVWAGVVQEKVEGVEGVLDEKKSEALKQYELGQAKAREAADKAEQTLTEAQRAALAAQKDAANDFNRGYTQGEKQGLFGLVSAWIDKSGGRPYVEDGKAFGSDIKEKGMGLESEAEQYAGKVSSGLFGPLSSGMSKLSGVLADGFQEGRVVGKDLEQNGPAKLRGAVNEKMDQGREIVGNAKDTVNGAYEDGKNVLANVKAEPNTVEETIVIQNVIVEPTTYVAVESVETVEPLGEEYRE